MIECFVSSKSLPEAYHNALYRLWLDGEIVPCPDYNTNQKEVSMTMMVEDPLREPMISKLFIGGYKELQQYVMEMRDGILDFEVDKGNWKYTYHNRMTQFPVNPNIFKLETSFADQIQFVIEDLKRNPDSRRAVINIRDNASDMYSDDPACLQHMQFFIRENKLHMKVLFRSNDACKATFMNAFALVMIQKMIADKLRIEVGTYTHRANSFHCYEKDFKMLDGYVNRIHDYDEGYLAYDYEDDWKDMMDECIPEIFENVEKLKG